MTRIRPDGGIAGSINNPSVSSASGMWSLKEQERATRAAIWPTPYTEGDPYFFYNTLLLHGDGSNGANNTVYVDSGPNLYTLTTGGRPLQGTFSPFSQTGWSGLFNPANTTTDNLATTNFDLSLTPGSSDYTIEFWVYPTTNAGRQNWFNLQASAGTNRILVYYTGTAISLDIGVGTSATSKISYTTPLSSIAFTWNHIAVSRTSGTTRMFLNGAQIGSDYATVDNWTAAFKLTTMRDPGGATWGSGFMSNIRYIIGTGLYSATFVPPTGKLSFVTGTRLLLLQDNYYKDNGANSQPLTITGTPSVQAYSPFKSSNTYTTTYVGGSAYFNGTTDHITLPNNMSVLGSNSYTLEGWFYPTTVAAAEIPLVKLHNATQTVELRIVSSKIQGRINGSATIVGGDTTLVPNQWYHFALVKPTAGTSTAVLYLNGAAEATTASDTTTYTAFTTPRIGANQTPNIFYTGWASNVRILNGVAQYAGNFTPPTAPFSSSAGTLALANFVNAGIIDNTSKSNFTTYGSAAINSTQNKFGGTSIYFDGVNSAITAPYVSSLHSFNLSDFTVELWVYPVSYSNMAHGASIIPVLIGGMQYNGTTSDWSFGLNNSGILKFYYYNGSAISINSSTTIPLNEWSHIAAVKTSSGISLFYNGTLVSGPTAISGTPSVQAGTTLTLGAHNNTFMNAYVDDVRISKYARYTASTSPPVAAFPNL